MSLPAPAWGRTGDREAPGVFEPLLLPEAAREDLCRGLLDEFGLTVRSVRAKDGELIVGCTLYAGHSDQDANPTGSLSWKRLAFHCLGCGASGGLLWFIASHRNISTVEAKSWLASETGTSGHLKELPALLKYFEALYARPGKPQMPTYGEQMLTPWLMVHPILTERRGIREVDVIRFKVGYAPDYQIDRDTCSERLVFPHFWQGRLVGWQTRRIVDDGTPKWKSTPDFPKESTIYNYDPDAREAVVVESMPSAIKHDHHHHIEATFGAEMPDRQVQLLSRHEKVVLWMDNDPGGWKTLTGRMPGRKQTHEGLMQRLAQTCNVFVVDNPYNADAGDLDFETAGGLIDNAVPWPLWRQPARLRCHRCEQDAHEGECRGGETDEHEEVRDG